MHLRRCVMGKRILILLKRIVYYYNYKQIPLAAAALCYYLIMTFFPMIICLYTLLGNNYGRARTILTFAENMLSADTVRALRTFLNYVAVNHSQAMFFAGIVVLLFSASAGVRSIMATLGRMQGVPRFSPVKGLFFSIMYAVAFLITVWFGILVMFTSRDLLRRLNQATPFIDISGSWLWMKYLLLGGMLFLVLWRIFRSSRARGLNFPCWPGALVGMLTMLGVSFLFSFFIAASTRYSLVYGSLTSVILLMLWMFFSGQAMYVGAAFNFALRDLRAMEELKRPVPDAPAAPGGENPGKEETIEPASKPGRET